jgi:hypothetical protein
MVLKQSPSADLGLYVIWLPMRPADARSEIDTALIDDRRARHYWDTERVTGLWFAEADLGGLGYSGVVWDAYFLFSPQAVWNERPTGLLGSGSTVLGEGDKLAAELEPFLEAGPGPSG